MKGRVLAVADDLRSLANRVGDLTPSERALGIYSDLLELSSRLEDIMNSTSEVKEVVYERPSETQVF